ncbi:MAG: adaptor protein MecA [Roseburia sp.]|nr:adaptor protein MecA [Roseburia sp.]
MDIKRLKGNQIRCALTEEEIIEMGFSIDEIIGNGETTQKFMRVVLEKVEEQEAIDVELLSPMVRAELLPDHSMAITFGGITEEEKKGMFGKILEMMNQMTGKPEVQPEAGMESENAAVPEFEQKLEGTDEEEIFEESTPLALECANIDAAVRMSRLFAGKDKVPQSALYKMDEKYYLLMDFKGFSKQEIKPLAFTTVEYDNRRIATVTGIAYIKEHGKCILAQDAICDLIQL